MSIFATSLHPQLSTDCSNQLPFCFFSPTMLPPVRSSMKTLVAWSRSLDAAQKRVALQFLWRTLCAARCHLLQVQCITQWLDTVLDMPKKQSESQRQGASCFIVRLCDKSVRAFRLLGEKSSTMPTTPRAFPGQVSGIAC